LSRWPSNIGIVVDSLVERLLIPTGNAGGGAPRQCRTSRLIHFPGLRPAVAGFLIVDLTIYRSASFFTMRVAVACAPRRSSS
jgi:hypothetical protein